MSIENLTVGDLLSLKSIFGNGTQSESKPNPFVGKYVIARCYSAGVHAGEVVSVDKDIVILKNSRRLWNWKAISGVALSGVAQNGLADGCKIDTMNPEIYLTGVCELITCSKISKESINDY